MKRTIVCLAVALLACSSSAVAGGDNKKDQDKMQGTWLIESFKDSDPKGGIPPEIAKDIVTEIKGDMMVVKLKDMAIVSLKFKLDSSKTPKAVDFTHVDGPDKGKVELGIYKFDGDMLVMAINDAGKDRPAAFATKEGTKISLITMKMKK